MIPTTKGPYFSMCESWVVNIPDKDGARQSYVCLTRDHPKRNCKNANVYLATCAVFFECVLKNTSQTKSKKHCLYMFIYICFSGCQCLVGLSHGKAKVCYYSGWYYCQSCHQDNSFLIPARLLHNWDTNKHKVSKCSPDPQNRQL